MFEAINLCDVLFGTLAIGLVLWIASIAKRARYLVESGIGPDHLMTDTCVSISEQMKRADLAALKCDALSLCGALILFLIGVTVAPVDPQFRKILGGVFFSWVYLDVFRSVYFPPTRGRLASLDASQ